MVVALIFMSTASSNSCSRSQDAVRTADAIGCGSISVTPASKRVKLSGCPDACSITPDGSNSSRSSTLLGTKMTDAETKEFLRRETGYCSSNSNAVSKRSNYICWNDYFMATAVLSSMRSKDPHNPSGCCIVDSHNRIIGIGYNGFTMGCSDDVLPWVKPAKDVPFLHSYKPYVVPAVINAILCSGDVRGARVFASEFPCAESAKTIIQAGISEVLYDTKSNSLDDIDESRKASRLMLQMAGIKLTSFTASQKEVELVRMSVEGESSPQPDTCHEKIQKEEDRLKSHLQIMQKEAGLVLTTSTKRSDYLTWDDYFMWMAFLTAQRSKDPNTQVGACLVLNERVVGLGYNGFPVGLSDDCLPWARQGESQLHTKYPYVCHAEVNAIMNRIFPDIKGSTLYVALFPCNECTKFIIQAGIREVVYLDDKYHDTDTCRASRIMFNMAGVKLRQHTPDQTSLLIHLNNNTVTKSSS